jgi:hypothetical protein
LQRGLLEVDEQLNEVQVLVVIEITRKVENLHHSLGNVTPVLYAEKGFQSSLVQSQRSNRRLFLAFLPSSPADLSKCFLSLSVGSVYNETLFNFYFSLCDHLRSLKVVVLCVESHLRHHSFVIPLLFV